MFSFRGIYALSKAKNIFVSHGAIDILPYLARGANMISLGHVVCPIKNMSYTETVMKLPFLHKIKLYLTDPYSQMNLITHEVVASSFTSNAVMFLRNTENNKDRILPLGLPKTDYQLSISRSCRLEVFNGVLNNIVPEKYAKQRIILFLPTWRSDPHFNVFNGDYDSMRLNNALLETQSILLINFHPFDRSAKLDNNISTTDSRIFVTEVSGDNIMKLLCAADIFITDYSSLFSDYLLYDKPIIFAKFSHEDYIQERDLHFPYDDLPGKKVLNWHEMEEAICNEIVVDNDQFFTHRKKMRKLIYDGHDDGLSSARIYKHFLDLNKTISSKQ